MHNKTVKFFLPGYARSLLKNPEFLKRINKDEGEMGYPLIRLAQNFTETDNGVVPESLHNEHKEVIYEYIKAGADPNVRDDFKGNTPLMWAIANAKVENALHFISHPAVDIEVSDDKLRTPLHLAVLKGYYHWDDDIRRKSHKPVGYAIDALLARGRQDGRLGINKQDHYGNTPLHYAAVHRDSDTVRKLIQHGADCSIINNNGEKPIDLLDLDYDEARELISQKVKPFTFDGEYMWGSQANLKFLRGFLTREEFKKSAAQSSDVQTKTTTAAENSMHAQLRKLSLTGPIGHSSVDSSKPK